MLRLTLLIIALGFLNPVHSNECTRVLRQIVGARVNFTLEANGMFSILNSTRTQFEAGNLENHLLKKIATPRRHADLPENFAGLERDLRASATQNKEERFTLLQDLNLAQVVAAPGHSVLRNPEQIKMLKKLILENTKPDLFSHDPLILNIITNGDGRIKFVDGWNGHHRLVAYLQAGKIKISELGMDNVTILVNGHAVNGEKWGHWLPANGVDLSVHKDYSPVPTAKEPYTLSFDGGLSNYALGSRFSVQGIQDRMLLAKPKIGVYFGSFDPLHEGHVDIAKKAREILGLDEVIFIPNGTPLHKPLITKLNHRLNMLAKRLLYEDGLNLYTGNSGELVNTYGNKAFLLRLVQLYGAENLHLIQGSDSMAKLMELNQVEKDGFPHLVFPRDQASRNFHVPAQWSAWIKPIDYLSDRSTSSSEVKALLKKGQSIDHLVHPTLAEYIKTHGLYQ